MRSLFFSISCRRGGRKNLPLDPATSSDAALLTRVPRAVIAVGPSTIPHPHGYLAIDPERLPRGRIPHASLPPLEQATTTTTRNPTESNRKTNPHTSTPPYQPWHRKRKLHCYVRKEHVKPRCALRESTTSGSRSEGEKAASAV